MLERKEQEREKKGKIINKFWPLYFYCRHVYNKTRKQKEKQEKQEKEKEKKKLILEWRGAGTAAYFYLGVWNSIFDHLYGQCDKEKIIIKFRGISSGSLMATISACMPTKLGEMVEKFDELVEEEYNRIYSSFFSSSFPSSRFLLVVMMPWMEAKIRFNLVPSFLKSVLTEEMVQQISEQGTLTIMAFDLLRLKVVEKSKWKNVDQLIEWICAGMTIPGVTSVAGKLVSSCDNSVCSNDNQSRKYHYYLIDALHFPKPFSSSSDGDKDGIVKISFSPLEIEKSYVDVSPTKSLPTFFSLFQLSPNIQKYLKRQGYYQATKFLLENKIY
jgi:hypothetical protein